MTRKSGKAVVISNCQCLPLAGALNQFTTSHFDFFGVHVLPPEQRGTLITQFVEKANSEYDFILTIPLSEEFGPINTSNIKNVLQKPIVNISNMYFSGLHPDLTYVGALSRRLDGPLGDYHSRIALHAYVHGLSVDEAVRRFNFNVYENANYFLEYENSMQTLVNRDEISDIKVVPLLKTLLKSQLCFLSVNHPSLALISAYSGQIAEHLQICGLTNRSSSVVDPNLLHNSLADSVIFPIYSEIAEYHGVAPFGSYAFKPNGAWAKPLTLQEFVEGEFAAFDAVGRDELTPNVQELIRTLGA